MTAQLIEPILTKKCQELLLQIDNQDSILKSTHKNTLYPKEAYEIIQGKLLDWLRPFFDLDDFPHFYFHAGATEAINDWLLLEKRQIVKMVGDYKWINLMNPGILSLQEISQIPSDSILYVSNPSSLSGNFINIWDEILKQAPSIALDCSYIGSVPTQKIPLNHKVEMIFFSLSKGFGLNKHRVGFSFWRKENRALSLKNKYSLINYKIPFWIDIVLDNYKVNDMHNFFKQAQSDVCRELSIQPSSSFLIGHSFNYEKDPSFLREDNKTFRIPLTKYLINHKSIAGHVYS